MKTLFSSFFLHFSIIFPSVLADLPVHCLTKHIAGIWILKLGPVSGNSWISCSHGHPDKNTDHLNVDFKSGFNVEMEFRLELRMPNEVWDPEKGEIVGNWTTIYDEGFEIRSKNRVFFAFSGYVYTGTRTPRDEDDEQTSGYQSLCNETFLGWVYHDNAEMNVREWGCFYGEKVGSDEKKSNSFNQNTFGGENNGKIVEIGSIFTKNNREIQGNENNDLSLYERFKQKLTLYEVPHSRFIGNFTEGEDEIFEPDYNFIEFVNNVSINSPWKAKSHDHFLNKSHRQMKNLLGLTRFKELKLQNVLDSLNTEKDNSELSSDPYIDSPSLFSSTLDDNLLFSPPGFLQLRSKLKSHSSPQWSLDSFSPFSGFSFESENPSPQNLCFGNISNEIPRCFDWRNIDSVNYDTPIQHQGECGSCYAVAALSALESRIRIHSKNTFRPKLSVSGVLACSRYNQGCNGGYPELVAKFGMDHGFYEEGCGGNGEFELCQESCYEGKVWKVKDYGYVGKGYYGSTSEQSMMREIVERGPIIVAINAAPDLYYYSSGVFISNPVHSFTQSNEHKEVNPWQFTNHAVVCVGWGETLHEGSILKYWILKNSWGKEWGEGGYFKMLRGVNLGAVENQAIFVIPDLD